MMGGASLLDQARLYAGLTTLRPTLPFNPLHNHQPIPRTTNQSPHPHDPQSTPTTTHQSSQPNTTKHSLKRERRKRREMKKKARVRAAQYSAGADGGEDAGAAHDDERMFSLGDLPGESVGGRVGGWMRGVDPLVPVVLRNAVCLLSCVCQAVPHTSHPLPPSPLTIFIPNPQPHQPHQTPNPITATTTPGEAATAKARKGKKGDALSRVAEASAPGEELLEELERGSSDDYSQVRLWGLRVWGAGVGCAAGVWCCVFLGTLIFGCHVLFGGLR